MHSRVAITRISSFKASSLFLPISLSKNYFLNHTSVLLNKSIKQAGHYSPVKDPLNIYIVILNGSLDVSGQAIVIRTTLCGGLSFDS